MERLSSAAVAEWMAYASIEPFGEERADLRMGILASVIANDVKWSRKKRPDPFSPRDFMPFIERTTPEAPSPDTLTTTLKQMFGHKSVKGKKG